MVFQAGNEYFESNPTPANKVMGAVLRTLHRQFQDTTGLNDIPLPTPETSSTSSLAVDLTKTAVRLGSLGMPPEQGFATLPDNDLDAPYITPIEHTESIALLGTELRSLAQNFVTAAGFKVPVVEPTPSVAKDRKWIFKKSKDAEVMETEPVPQVVEWTYVEDVDEDQARYYEFKVPFKNQEGVNKATGMNVCIGVAGEKPSIDIGLHFTDDQVGAVTFRKQEYVKHELFLDSLMKPAEQELWANGRLPEDYSDAKAMLVGGPPLYERGVGISTKFILGNTLLKCRHTYFEESGNDAWIREYTYNPETDMFESSLSKRKDRRPESDVSVNGAKAVLSVLLSIIPTNRYDLGQPFGEDPS